MSAPRGRRSGAIAFAHLGRLAGDRFRLRPRGACRRQRAIRPPDRRNGQGHAEAAPRPRRVPRHRRVRRIDRRSVRDLGEPPRLRHARLRVAGRALGQLDHEVPAPLVGRQRLDGALEVHPCRGDRRGRRGRARSLPLVLSRRRRARARERRRTRCHDVSAVLRRQSVHPRLRLGHRQRMGIERVRLRHERHHQGTRRPLHGDGLHQPRLPGPARHRSRGRDGQRRRSGQDDEEVNTCLPFCEGRAAPGEPGVRTRPSARRRHRCRS